MILSPTDRFSIGRVLSGPRLVPQPRRPIVAGGGEQAPVRAERHLPDHAVVAGQGAQVLA